MSEPSYSDSFIVIEKAENNSSRELGEYCAYPSAPPIDYGETSSPVPSQSADNDVTVSYQVTDLLSHSFVVITANGGPASHHAGNNVNWKD